MKKEQRFNVGDKVFAKVKGYPAWPAIVLEETGKKYKVKFYGTGEIGQIKQEDLFYYTKNKHKLLKPSKRKDFNDSVEEIEEAIRIAGTDGSPDCDPEKDNSILNDSSSTTDLDSSIVSKKRKRSLSVVKQLEEKSNLKSKKGKFTDEKSNDENSVQEETRVYVVESKDMAKDELVKEDDKNDFTNLDTKSEETVAQSLPTSPIKDQIETNELSNQKNFVSESELKALIAFGNHVEKHKEIYTNMSIEKRYDSKFQVHPFLNEKKCIGIKLHRVWPLDTFENEYERALYDKEMAERVLNLKSTFKLENLKVSPNDYWENINVNREELSKFFEEKVLTIKQEIFNQLKIEESLLELDTKIKNSLGLDKAEPKEAIVMLEEILNLKLTCIMLKKHAHVVDMVRRLRKYIGNIDRWNLTEEEKKIFRSDAEAVRNAALKVYVKFMNIVKETTSLPIGETFWDTFNDIATKFREETKDFSEIEFYNLTCEPHSRKNILNNYFIKNILLTMPLPDIEKKDISSEKPEEKKILP